jgi:class 3 adenylate cyclase/tetratricopeptide (TPR) repeat protein
VRCPHCGGANPDGANFCAACGGRLGAPCPRCGHANLPGNRFCNDCGAPLEAPARFGAPDVYTPDHLAGRIRMSRSALEGERKRVTVLFADLRGSLELLAGRDPEEARGLLDPLLERMMEAVHRYEGTVNQVMGDGIMALFGAPIAHEDHAVRACFAALRMQESIGRHAAAAGPGLKIRIGLNSGEVVVRAIRSDLHMEYSAIGQTTHLASRMEGLAPAGTILMTAGTARLVEGYVGVRPFGRVPVKGLAEPVEAFELTGPGRVRTRLQAVAARGLSRFVGRAGELGALARALEAAGRGHGQVVAVVGEPGVGKSRLVAEFLRSSATDGWLTLQAQGVAYARAVAYRPLVDALETYFGIDDDDAPARVADKVRFGLDPEELPRLLAPLAALLDAPVDDPAWSGLEPEQRRRRTQEAVRHLLLRRSGRQPVCLLVEDLHWIDPETQGILDGLVDALPGGRLLLIVTYRPEYQHAWAARTFYTQVRVDPLPRASAEALLRELLGGGPGVAALAGLLLERTEGNPFFLEESVRNLVETGVLAGERGRYTLQRPPHLEQVPDSVASVLAARIDRLPAEDKHVLQAAAALGRDVPRALLAAVTEVPGAALEQSLARLQAGEFLYEARFLPEVGYAFKHALTLEVAYGGLVRDRRRTLDARIIEVLERDYPAIPAEHVDRLAHHAVRAEAWAKAVRYCCEAGRRAFARSAHRSAAGYFEQALAALAEQPETPETLAAAIDLRLELRYALSPLGEYRRMLDCLTEAERLAVRLDDRRRLGLVTAFLLNFATLRGDLDRAVEYGRRALDLAGEVDDPALRVLAHAFLALAHYGRGEYRRAVDLAARNLDLLAGEREAERFGMALLPAVYCRTVMAWSLAELGEFPAAAQAAREAVAIAERAGHGHSRAFAALGLGTVHWRRGALPEAVAALEAARDLCESGHLPAVLLEVAAPLASAYVESGRAADAIALLEHAIAQAIALRHRIGHWLRAGGLGEAYLAAGRLDEALPMTQLYVEITRVVGARGSHAWAQRLAAEALAQAGPDKGDAEAAFAAALALAEELGMRPLQARCLLARAAARRRAGDVEGARTDLEAAIARLADLDMPAWRARAEQARRTLV